MLIMFYFTVRHLSFYYVKKQLNFRDEGTTLFN